MPDFRRAPLIFSGAIVVAIWFWFARDGLSSFFSGDDLMNMYLAWQRPLAGLIKDNLLFFSPGYRPMGNLAYRLLYEAAGFHPLPFRIACFSLLLINLFLVYRTTTLLASKEAGMIAALFAGYNVGVDVNHDVGVIFDILCFTFYFLALGFYASIRLRKQCLGPLQTVGLLLLYIGALDAKEMAVTLPAVLVAYELLLGEGRALIRRLLPPVLAGLITLPYLAGKLTPPSPLLNNQAYTLQITLTHYLTGLTHYLDFIVSLHPDRLTLPMCIMLLIAAALLTAIVRDRGMAFALAFVLITPLPVVFVGLRGAYVMYIPLFGIGLFLALSIIKLRDRLVGPDWKLATFLVCAAAVVAFHSARPWRPYVNPLIQSTVEQLQKIQPTVHPNARVLFLDDPFSEDDTWDLLYICRLYYRLPGLVVDRVRQMPAKPDQPTIDSYDLVFTYRGTELTRIKPES